MNKVLLITALFFVCGAFIAQAGESFLEQATAAYNEGRIDDAITLFKAAINEQPKKDSIYLSLGNCYFHQSEYEKAQEVLMTGARLNGPNKDDLYYSLARSLVAQQKTLLAEEMFTTVIQIEPEYAAAYMGRGNLYINSKEYAKAIEDLKMYLVLEPLSSQRDNVTQAIAVMQNILEREEAERLARKEEDERKRKEEEERLKNLVDGVIDSLESASEDTTNLSAGTEDIEYNEEDEEGDEYD